MEKSSENLNVDRDQSTENISKINSKFIFITQNFANDSTTQNDNQNICQYCKSKFFSKFNKDRHINAIHLKMRLKKNIDEHAKGDILKKNIIKIESSEKNHKSKDCPSNIQKINLNNKLLREKDDGCPNDNLIYLNNDKEKSNNSIFIEEKAGVLFINANNKSDKKNISYIIKHNFYDILKNNKYFCFGNYFLFENCMLGNGKYGTVYFGLDFKNAKAVAIKISNEKKRNSSLNTEILIMKKLSKYKIFSKIYHQVFMNERIYLVESLQGPDLYKLKKFCGKKFSIITVYKIGIEILQCLKLIHKIGYIYLDIKDDNISVLCKPIKYKKRWNNIILIDYGFCEKFSNDMNNAPKIYGNSRYSSINALRRNPVSRKDDIIALCYFLAELYNGFLPLDNISTKSDKIEEIIKIKENYPFKNVCGSDAKEILFIYDDANCLKFFEIPNYDHYIYLLENFISIKTGKSQNDILFDWDAKIKHLIKEYDGAENLLMCDKDIAKLFAGYPDFFVQNYLEKYSQNK